MALPAGAGDGFVDGDAREPRGQLRAAVELAQVRVGVDPGLLHDVFGLALVEHDGPRRAVEPLVVAAHEDLEQRRLPRQDQLDHLRVRQPRPPLQNRAADHVHGY